MTHEQEINRCTWLRAAREPGGSFERTRSVRALRQWTTRTIAIAALAATSAQAQTVTGQNLDPVIAATTQANQQAQAAQQQAAAAQSAAQAAQAQASAAAAAIPPVCSMAPARDTLNGSVGAATACTPLSDNTRPTAVQAGNTTLAANCTFTITFARAFTSATPFVYAAVVDSSGNQMPCKIQSRSTQTETGVCAPANSTALNLSIVTTGLTLTPFGTTCTAGTPVMFVGREPTQ